MQEDIKKNFVRIESVLNRKDNQLPFALYCPQSEGKTVWHCNYDQENKICSVFSHKDGDEEKKIPAMHKTLEEVISIRNDLITAGWALMDPPGITMKYDDGSEKPLNRKQKRALGVKLGQMAKESDL